MVGPWQTRDPAPLAARSNGAMKVGFAEFRLPISRLHFQEKNDEAPAEVTDPEYNRRFRRGTPWA